MVDLLQLAPVSLDQAVPKLEIPPIALEYEVLSQTVLKLTQPLPVPGQSGAAKRIGTAGLVAMQQLVEIITQAQSIHSDLSPQTPETLLPYVQEEAQDALSALQAAPPPQTETAPPEVNWLEAAEPLWQNYFWLKTFTPWLLWGAARSTYEVMRLMEGTTARVLQPSQGWQEGILRLIPLLELNLSGLSYWVDLATHQTALSALSPASLIQLNDNVLCQQPTSVAKLTQRLTDQIQSATPAVHPFLDGVQAEILMPHQDWDSGLVQLHLAFEFIPKAPATETQISSSEAIPSSTEGAHLPALQPVIKFTDTAWLEQYETTAVQEELATLLSQRPCFKAIEALEADPATQTSLSLLVQEACALSDRLQTSLTLASRNFLGREMELDDLAFRLLWCLSRSAYEVMQLMSGIQATLLQPNSNWASGTLRFLVSLKVQTPELDWCLDLVTGQPLNSDFSPLAPDVIVQSTQSNWCQQPILLQSLQTKIQQQLDQVAPEVQLLLEGTELDLLGGDRQWQPGTMQLNAGFEFIPAGKRIDSLTRF